jgi:hypothetical protein
VLSSLEPSGSATNIWCCHNDNDDYDDKVKATFNPKTGHEGPEG